MAEVSPEVTRDVWAQLTDDPRKPFRYFGYSTSTVSKAVKRLAELGYLTYVPGQVNTIVILVRFWRI